jgi:phospho-N-acetylmuramoyl-pentapeptide-transferase
MALYLLFSIISFFVHFVCIVPFINFLYAVKFQRLKQKTKDPFNKPTPIFDKFNAHKSGTPVGGGILILLISTILFGLSFVIFYFFDLPIQVNYPSIFSVIRILLFTFIGFGFLGIYDDLTKIFFWKKSKFFGLRMRHKLILEIILALTIGYWLYADLQIDIIHVPFWGVIDLSWGFIFFAAFVIIAFSNAVNITDGLDGLAAGVLMISLVVFWVVARSIIDVPTSIFIAIWLGGIIAFLYFNIYPARIIMGDAGALSFGATFAVVGLILGKSFSLPIIGGVFLLELLSSFIQLLSKKYLKKKAFEVAPLHLLLQMKGWEEPKIVMRLWIIAIIFGIVGLTIGFMN